MDKAKLTQPSMLKDLSAVAKELKYAIKQEPGLFSAVGAICATATVGVYYINPWLCAWPTAALTSIPFIAFIEAAQRKYRYKSKTFSAITDGDFVQVTEFASKTCYDETDPQALKEQNTEFLFEALDLYDDCVFRKSNYQEAYNYSHAALIFLKHQANVKKVSDVLKYCVMPHASKWLIDNASDLKQN